MDVHRRTLILSLLLLATLSAYTTATITHAKFGIFERHTYIVSLRPPNFSFDMSSNKFESWYRSFLPPALLESMPHTPFIHTYREAIVGFAVNLTQDEADYVSKRAGVLHVYEDKLRPLLTTRTPDFLGLRSNGGAWNSLGMGEGSIIGILDTGIDFSHTSFDDDGMKPPPSKWHGSCEFGSFKCNNKLIGGRSLVGGYEQPEDDIGHGTHTASTAAGRFVEGANVLGNGNGTAAGMAPHAHLAIYKVCSPWGCFDSDIIAGIEAAISDGVDILSVSLGASSQPFHEDIIAIGAFHAMRKGILISCAAGNSGPLPRTLGNEAPWVLTVGASTMDRKMDAFVNLGNGLSAVGESAYQPSNIYSLPLVYGLGGSENVTGKVVALEVVQDGSEIDMGKSVKDAGGAGIILLGNKKSGHITFAQPHVLPASHVNYQDADVIRQYVKSSNKLTASIIFNGTSLGKKPAPVVAYFSSRGPSIASPGILKPDIIGPGVNVIAAWPFKVGPNIDGQHEKIFNSISGTSMSTPHLSGIAALVNSMHRDWSPAAIKSAIMTTAYVMDDNKEPILDENLNPAGHFSIGAGHVNPSKVINPGLVYDIGEEEYTSYLCGLGYSDDEVEKITLQKGVCGKGGKIAEAELNYPSLALRAGAGKYVVNRTVTNVGDAMSSYTIEIDMPKEVKISVTPAKLEFTKVNEKKTFSVSLSWDANKTKHVEGSFRWISRDHVVRSPIVIF
ncbi:hypothetical protein EJB05_23909, partial [Eragrostis curvula]